MHLRTQLLVALVVGASAGIASKLVATTAIAEVLIAFEPFGMAFIRLITMVVVPLVVGSLFVATASLGDTRKLAGLGGRTLAYFLVTTVIAALIGLVLPLLARPGVDLDPAVRDAIASAAEADLTASERAAEERPSLVRILVEMIPRNPVAAAADMNLLPLILATLVFGAAASQISEGRSRVLVTFFEGVNETSMVVIRWVMKLAPYAVAILIAASVARFGLELLERLLVYSVVVAAGLFVHVFVVLCLAIRFLGKTGVLHFFRQVAGAWLVAFSTSSSNATLPVSMEVARKNLGIPNEVASFVLPLGATLNMNGSALYKAVTAVFVAQVYGLALGPSELFTIVLTSTLAAIAGAGVPGSSLVTTLIVLNAIGLGPNASAGIALVLGVDRILDMMRTSVNVLGDLTATVVIARGQARAL